jgi:hypothetical protein
MFPLEAIGVLGILYLFFMVGTLKALRAKTALRREAGTKPFVKELTPGAAWPTA